MWSRFPVDRGFRLAVGLCAAAGGGLIALMFVFVGAQALPALAHYGWQGLFADATWAPSDGRVGLGRMLAATLVLAGGALAWAFALGVAIAWALHFVLPPWAATIGRRMLEIGGAVPSVVMGLWGILVVVPWLSAIDPPGTNLLAGILVLGLMVLPTIALIADGALKMLPAATLEGGLALGLSRPALGLRIALPAASGGLIAAAMLGFGRAVGETMAVMMVTGNVVQWPNNLWAPVRALTANIALEMAYAMDHHRAALFAGGALLMTITALLLLAAGWAQRQRGTPAHA